MARNQIMFYATAPDLGSVLSALEEEHSFQYTRTGLFLTNTPETYFSYTDIPEFGQANHPNAVGNPSYLLAPRGTQIHLREVPQKSGGVRFAIDQAENDDTVVLQPGGAYGDAVILYGMVGTISSSTVSKSLLRLIGRQLRKNFTKEREFLLGREAREAWNSGVRLTIGAASPAEFDLKHGSIA